MSSLASAAVDHRPSVLFVDDEEDVLAGIRSSLRKERKRFDFRFAVGGADALSELERRPAAVIVSDMRMPGMDGAELLCRAKTACPESVRIVLTGEAEASLVLRSLPVAHQWLSKPCDREDLVAALDAAVRYRNLLTDPELIEAVAGIDNLASPPPLHRELMAMAANATTSVEEIAQVAATDPAVAAKLIQLANSAFSGGSPVLNLNDAIVRVGLDNLCHLVLSVELLGNWHTELVVPGLDIATNASLSQTAARVAKHWCSTEQSVAAIAGLLHNVGILVESQAAPDRLRSSLEAASAAGINLVDFERATHGSSHLEMAGHLLSIWGVPAPIVLSVVGCSDPMSTLTPGGTADDAVRLGVRVAQRQHGEAIPLSYRTSVTTEESELVDRVLFEDLSLNEMST